MALDRLTKVDGGGINTTSDYRVGIITASKFVGPFDGTGGNFSGVVTATNGVFSGNISAVDGNFSGNVTIGGTLTYEDVTNIDSVGLITARDGIFLPDNKEVKIGNTASNPDIKIWHQSSSNHSFIDNTTGNLYIRGGGQVISLQATNVSHSVQCNPNSWVKLYNAGSEKLSTTPKGITVGTGVTIETNGQATYTGIITATGADINGDIDVDGQTSLDHTTIAGIVTFLSGSGLDLATHNRSAGMRIINNGNSSSDGMYIGYGNANNGATRLFGGGLTSNPTVINSTGVSIPNDLNVDGHTNLDNISIAGVTTITGSQSFLNIISTTQGLGLNLRNTSNEYTRIIFDAARTGASSALGILEGKWNNGNSVCQIYLQSGDDTTNKDDGRISMVVNSAAGSNKTAFRIEPDASVHLPNDSQKLQFGNDQDLSIWHGGSNGYIDNETGNLSIRTTSSNAEKLRITSGGSVNIGGDYSQTSQKLKVTGNTTIDGTLTAGIGFVCAGGFSIFSGNVTQQGYTFHDADSNTYFGFPGADQFDIFTAGSSRMHIHSDGRFRVGCTAQPSGTVGGFQLDMGSYPGTLRLMSGAGASGTQSASINIGGSNHHANLGNGSNYGAQCSLFNYNSTDGNSTAVSFHNSSSLAIARVLGHIQSHSSRLGNLVFMTSDGAHPEEKARLTHDGKLGLNTTDPIGTLDVYDGTFVLSKPNASGNERNWRFVNNNVAAGNLGLQVSTAAGGSTFSNLIEITRTGRVGINEGTPKATLDVRGTAIIADDIGSVPSTFPAPNTQLLVYTSTNGQPIDNVNCARLCIATDAKQVGAQGYNGAIDFGNSDSTASGSSAQYNWRVASIMSNAAGDTGNDPTADGDLQFWTKTGSGSLTKRVVITQAGDTIFGNGISEGTTEPFFVETGGTIRRRYSTTAGSGIHFTGGALMPTTGTGAYNNGGTNIGTGSYRWGQIYSSSSSISTSDRTLKNTIQSSDLGLEFIKKLNPVSYKFNDGNSGRTHYGLISQDVETVLSNLGKTGIDFGGFCKDRNTRVETKPDENGHMIDVNIEEEGHTYSLRYEEFIGPLIKAVQDLANENIALRERVSNLEGS